MHGVIEGRKTRKSWPAERDEQLRQLLAAGATAKQAGELLGVTRNAVIGRAHRLGLVFCLNQSENLPENKSRKGLLKFQASRRAVKKTSPPPAPPPPMEQEAASWNPLLPVEWQYIPSPFPRDDMNVCPWPLWKEGEPAKFCCGAPRAEGRPYCKRHNKIANGRFRETPAEVREHQAAIIRTAWD